MRLVKRWPFGLLDSSYFSQHFATSHQEQFCNFTNFKNPPGWNQLGFHNLSISLPRLTIVIISYNCSWTRFLCLCWLVVTSLLIVRRSRWRTLTVGNVVSPLDNSLVTNTFSSGMRLSFFFISQTKRQLHNNFKHLGYCFFGKSECKNTGMPWKYLVMQLILHFCAPNRKQNNVVHTRLPEWCIVYRMMYCIFLHINNFKHSVVVIVNSCKYEPGKKDRKLNRYRFKQTLALRELKSLWLQHKKVSGTNKIKCEFINFFPVVIGYSLKYFATSSMWQKFQCYADEEKIKIT